MSQLSLDSFAYPSSPLPGQTTHLPTPPFSPPQTLTDVPPEASAVLINSLVSFYQQESLWVHRTRAALELALTTVPRQGSLQGAPSSSATFASSSSDTPSMTDESDYQSVKPEPTTPPPLEGRHTRGSRWQQRKKSFKLKLEGMPPHALQHRRRQRRTPGVASAPETGTRLLELFGELMEARMESCHRVSRLVKEANRADLYTS
ncbi:hypothetical protein BV25DRAFT_1817680 [Artomyces pyxidatus]|uniref:Uncharacterized protein n=1 Tax=Artomyces pyxidatus TaxID=48021 RepID=A0ACB8TJZ8_9AGAM|nr:hypothetical protein BV25DRAFT_1817680 [Artomyces pyxidatus]